MMRAPGPAVSDGFTLLELLVALAIFCITQSGITTPGTSLWRNSAFRSEVRGQIPARIGMPAPWTNSSTSSSFSQSNTGCVIANSAPASAFW